MFYKTFIWVILFTTLFVQTASGSDIYHIPPAPPVIGEAVSFEITFAIDVEVMDAIFFYRMDGQQAY